MDFKGRIINDDELKIIKNLPSDFYPIWLLNIAKDLPLIERYFSLSEQEDNSNFGVEMQWMTIQEQIDEIYNAYPSKVAIKYDFYPVGKCLEGSGDPYFVKQDKKNDFKIYRIPHESVTDDILDLNEIDYICSLQELLNSH